MALSVLTRGQDRIGHPLTFVTIRAIGVKVREHVFVAGVEIDLS
jgi:hypothetical protein